MKKEKVVIVFPYTLDGNDIAFCGEYTIGSIIDEYADYNTIIFVMKSSDEYDYNQIEDNRVRIYHDNDIDQIKDIFIDLVNLDHKYICSEEVRDKYLYRDSDDKKWKDLRKF